MPAKNPRVNVVLEETLYASVLKAAKRDGVPVSTKVRDLVREALEASEDHYLVAAAEERERYFSWDKGLSHAKVFGKAVRKRRS